MVGQFWRNRGDLEHARTYWIRSANGSGTYFWLRAIGVTGLRNSKVKREE